MTKLERLVEGMGIKDDVSLADVLTGIIETQSMLPASKRDNALFEEALDALLSLRGYDPDCLSKRARRISEEIRGTTPEKRRYPVMRRLLPAVAAIALIAAVTCAIGYGTKFSISSLTGKMFAEMEPGVEYGDESTTIIIAKEFAEYRSYGELFSAMPELELVYLENIPDGYTIERVLYSDYVQYTDIAVSLTDGNGHKVIINVRNGTPVDLSNRETVQMGSYDVATCYHGGNIQGDISVRDMYVTVTAPDEVTLAAVAEGLAERVVG